MKPILFLDTETTGLSHDYDEVLEIGIIDQHGQTCLNKIVKPRLKTSWPEAQAIHGLSPEKVMLESKDLTLVDWAPNIAKLINAAEKVVVYNLAYDKPFLDDAFRAAGVTIDESVQWQCAMLDYAKAMGEWNPKRNQWRWHKLVDAAAHVGHVWEGEAHRAVSDCQATLSVWNWLQDEEKQSKHELDSMVGLELAEEAP